MNRSEKRIATIIEKYGSIEEFNKKRYHNPKAIEDQKRAASLGGKKSTGRPFRDPVKAKEASKKGLEARYGD